MQSKRMLSKWRPSLATYFLLGCLLVADSGCETSDGRGKAQIKPTAGQSSNHGYALLAALCGDEKDVAKIRFLKRERPELKTLLQEIAETNRVAYQALQR